MCVLGYPVFRSRVRPHFLWNRSVELDPRVESLPLEPPQIIATIFFVFKMSYSLTFNEAHSFKRDCCSVAREILRNLAEAMRIIYFFIFALVFFKIFSFSIMHTADVSLSYSSGSSLELRMYSRGARAPAERVKCAEHGNFSISEASRVHSWGFAAFKLGTSRMLHRCLH